MNKFTIYTDGSSKGNPGPGGWAFLIMGEENENMILSYGSDEYTTNNRMEMMAVINAIEKIKRITDKAIITIYTDSKYVEGTINNGWLLKWIKDSFKGKKNVDLWVRLYGLICSVNVTFKWVKGHGTDIYNQLVDHYASEVAGTKTKISESIIKKDI
jgi:ribonuclease HI